MDCIIDLYTYSAPAIFFLGSIYVSYYLGKIHRTALEEAYTYKITYKTETQRFLDLFDTNMDTNMNTNINTNSNIHPDLYCYEKWQSVIEETNEEEQKWKNRILFQHTPQGNVMMWYDLYKQAFAYLSDTNISYIWLNECAMKYVRMYCCRDFFVDTHILPETYENPFNAMKLEEEKKEREKKKEKKNALKLDLDSSVFMKKKKPSTNIRQNTTSQSQSQVPESSQPITKRKFVNNFRHIGKIQNYSILQIYPIPKKRTPDIHNATYNETQDSPKEAIAKDYQYIEYKKQKGQKGQMSKPNFFDSFFV